MAMWFFGYGSLMWKVDFPYEEKVIGYIKGYQRRFYQHSTDHRGTPDSPGRVVTLLPGNKDEKVFGIAYRIHERDVRDVIDHLDYREKGGYERKNAIFYPNDENMPPFEMVIYLAAQDNPNYAGPAHLDEIAYTVVNSVGPSGPNVDYVTNLAAVMRQLIPDANDDHLFGLEEKVLALMEKENENCRKFNNNKKEINES